jgi:hypothetical protein
VGRAKRKLAGMHYLPVLVFVAGYAVATLWWNLPLAVGLAYLVASVACFAAYAIDKAAARSKARRTPERTLLLLGLAGGWPGAVLAQHLVPGEVLGYRGAERGRVCLVRRALRRRNLSAAGRTLDVAISFGRAGPSRWRDAGA